jgi:hypothetical protein
MQTKPLPEIEESDLRAAREFLTSFRDEERATRTPFSPLGSVRPARGRGQNQLAVPVRNGISRARTRPGAGTGSGS